MKSALARPRPLDRFSLNTESIGNYTLPAERRINLSFSLFSFRLCFVQAEKIVKWAELVSLCIKGKSGEGRGAGAEIPEKA